MTEFHFSGLKTLRNQFIHLSLHSRVRKINFHIFHLPFLLHLSLTLIRTSSFFVEERSKISLRRLPRRVSPKKKIIFYAKRNIVSISNSQRHIGRNQCIKKPVFEIIFDRERAYKERLLLLFLLLFMSIEASHKIQEKYFFRLSTYLF